MQRDDLIKLAREAAAGPHRPSYCDNPTSFEPHEWVIEAMLRAYNRGVRDGARAAGSTALYPGGRVMQAVDKTLAELGVREPVEPMRAGGRVRRPSVKIPGESKAARRLRRKAEARLPRVRDHLELDEFARLP